MEITRVSMFSGKEHVREIDVTTEQIDSWQSGTLIQNAMPHLSAEDREFLMTGITPEEWNEEFGDDDTGTMVYDVQKKIERKNNLINGVEIVGEIPDTPYVDGVWERADGKGWYGLHKSPGGSSSMWSPDQNKVNEWLKNSIEGTRLFWEEKVKWDDTGYPKNDGTMVIRVNGNHYVAKPGIVDVPAGNSFVSPRSHLGHAGHLFAWEFLDEPGKKYHSNNVWAQGQIPPEFAGRLPDNARWIS